MGPHESRLAALIADAPLEEANPCRAMDVAVFLDSERLSAVGRRMRAAGQETTPVLGPHSPEGDGLSPLLAQYAKRTRELLQLVGFTLGVPSFSLSSCPLGWTPRPPQAGAPGSPKMMAPHRPCRRLQTPPGLGSPSPQAGAPGSLQMVAPRGPCRRFRTPPWAGLPVPPRPVCPVLRRCRLPMGPAGYSDHPLGWTPRPPQAGVPGS